MAVRLALSDADARRRPAARHDLREVFNGLRWVVRTGGPVAHDAQRPAALAHGVSAVAALAQGQGFKAMVHGLLELLRVAGGRNAQPSAAVLDGCTLQSPPRRAGGRRLRRLQAQKRLKILLETILNIISI